MLMISPTKKVYELKRKIEKEFSELFPKEQPFVVSKLEEYHTGYVLSSNSKIEDVI